MTRSPSVWIVPAALALLLGLAADAHANWFFQHCFNDCKPEVVELPGQKVVVETMRPHVVVHETQFRERPLRLQAVQAPFVATIFTPAALTVNPLVAAPGASDLRTFDDSLLRSAQELELSHLQYQTMRAMHEAQLQASKDVMTRLNAANSTNAGQTAKTADLEQVRVDIKALGDRIDTLEKVVSAHSEFMKQKHPDVQPGDPKKKE
jgi:hypothetical protein